MAFAAFIFACVFAWCLDLTVSGQLQDNSIARLAVMVLITGGVLFLSLVCLLSALRSRVIVGPDGLDIVHVFKREHVPWIRITGISLRYNRMLWDVEIQMMSKKQVILVVPVRLSRWTIPTEYYDEPTRKTPRRLRKQYALLREAWQANIAAW